MEYKNIIKSAWEKGKRAGMIALAGALPYFSSLESNAGTTNMVLNGATNVWAGPVMNVSTGDVDRVAQYLFRASSENGGYISGNTNDWFNQGTTNQLSAHPEEGRFVQWKRGGNVLSTNRTYNFVLNESMKDVVASFPEVPLTFYDFRFIDSKKGIDETKQVLEGESAYTNFNKFVAEGDRTRHHAEKVKINGIESSLSGATNISTGPLYANKTIEVLRTPEDKIIASVLGDGYLRGMTNNWVARGSGVDIEAIANQGSSFKIWEGAPSGKEGQNPLLYSSDAPRDLVANFSKDTLEYLIRTFSEGNGSIIPSNPVLKEGTSTNFAISSQWPLYRIALIEKDGDVIYSNHNKLNDNSFIGTNLSYVAKENGSLNVLFEPMRIPFAADFDGDGLADPAVHDEQGNLKVFLSGNGYAPFVGNFGTQGKYPLAGDFDGDGRPDIAFIQDSGIFNILFARNGYSGMTGPFSVERFGIPFAADFNQDRRDDIGIQEESGDLNVYFSGSNYETMSGPHNLGTQGKYPLAGKIQNGGDLAFVDSDGRWSVNYSPAYGSTGPFPLGKKGTPLLGDFDGDGKADPTMFDKDGRLHIWFSGSGYAYGGPYNLGL